MTLAEILKAKGIGDEIVNGVLNDMKANKIYTANEENLDVRYGKLKTDHEGVTKQLGEANALIEELKQSNKGNEDLQKKVTDYESQISALQEQLKQTQIDSEANTALLAAGVKPDDIDYVLFKLKAKGDLELGEDGKIKGMEDKIAALKTQLPAHFQSAADGGDGYRVLDPNKLEKGDGGEHIPTKEEFQAMNYEQRVALKQKNEELYKKLKQ